MAAYARGAGRGAGLGRARRPALLSEIYAYVGLASLWNCSPAMPASSRSASRPMSGSAPICCSRSPSGPGCRRLWAIPIAGMIAAAVAIPVAVLVFRLRGHYFAIGTWIVAEVFRLLASQVSVLGGGSGISLPAAIVIRSRRRAAARIPDLLDRAGAGGAILALIVLLLRSRYGLALKAIRDSELAATCNGVDVRRTKVLVYIVTACGTAMIGALIFLQKLRISPDAAFSVNDWTAFVIFITVIGGIGRIEGPIVGTVVFFLLRQTLADLGTLYLLMLGAVAIVVMLWAPKGIWGLSSSASAGRFSRLNAASSLTKVAPRGRRPRITRKTGRRRPWREMRTRSSSVARLPARSTRRPCRTRCRSRPIRSRPRRSMPPRPAPRSCICTRAIRRTAGRRPIPPCSCSSCRASSRPATRWSTSPPAAP